MPTDFQGVLYDIVSEQIIDRAPIIRGTYAEAMADAHSMVGAVNAQAEAIDDNSDSNSTIGRVDASYCFVMVNGEIAYDEPASA